MKIKVIQNFYDRENDLVLREKGAELEVSEQRGRELIAKGFAAEVKPKEEKKTESEKVSAVAIVQGAFLIPVFHNHQPKTRERIADCVKRHACPKL